MHLKNYNVYFFFAALVGITFLAFLIMKPLIVPFLIAAILAHLFSPAYEASLKLFRKSGLSSALICLLVALIIIIPVILIALLVINEIQDILSGLNENPEAVRGTFNKVAQAVSSLSFIGVDLNRIADQDAIISGLRGFSQNALLIIQSIYKGVAHFVFSMFIMFFSLFYLLIDGKKLVRKIMELSPLRDEHENVLIKKFNSISRAMIKGTTMIAVWQGALVGMLFAATGVSSPVIFGLLAAIISIIPSVGVGLVWLPVGLFVIFFGDVVSGIIILSGGVFISTIDNVLRPKLVGRDTQMHPLMVLFSTLGGVALFGIPGLIIGPIFLALFVAMWDIYALEFKAQLDRYNN
ncbi:MAG TPA: hypothetical protein DIT25_02010 [Candidatus Moranbacteria bacterium]|nr:hypothetical protein [Candidatus Moranbacteria bacterium]